MQNKSTLVERKKVVKQLHYAFTGILNTKDDIIRIYDELLTPKDAIQKAAEYLESARKGKANSKSDWGYWNWNGDILKAKILLTFFAAIDSGITRFPPIPKISNMILMDRLATLEEWAETIKERGRK
jgi:hypothetical protein